MGLKRLRVDEVVQKNFKMLKLKLGDSKASAHETKNSLTPPSVLLKRRLRWALTDVTHSVHRRSISNGQNHQNLHNIHRWEIAFVVENMQVSRCRWIVHHQTTFTTARCFPVNGSEMEWDWWDSVDEVVRQNFKMLKLKLGDSEASAHENKLSLAPPSVISIAITSLFVVLESDHQFDVS
jgi:hypothetical protein